MKSVTPYFSQSEKGTEPWGGGKFSASPWERTGGMGREENSWGYGGGGLQSGGAGDGGLVSSLTRRDSSGQGKGGKGPKGGECGGVRKEKRMERKEN